MATIYYCKICEDLIVDEDELPIVGDFCSRKCAKLFDKYGLQGGKKEYKKKSNNNQVVADVPVRNLPSESIPENIESTSTKKKPIDDKNVVFKNINSFFTRIDKDKSNNKQKDYDDSLEYLKKQSEIENSMRDIPHLDNPTGYITNNTINKPKEQLDRPSSSRLENHGMETTPHRVNDKKTSSPTPPSRVDDQRTPSPTPPPRVNDKRTSSPTPPSRVDDQRTSTPPPPPPRVNDKRTSSPTPPSRLNDQRTPTPPPRLNDQRTSTPPPPPRVNDRRRSPPRLNDRRTPTPPPHVDDQIQVESQSASPSLYPDLKQNRPPLEDFDCLDINDDLPPSYDTLYPDPPPQPVEVEKPIPLQPTENKPVVTDQKKPIVTDQKRPIVTDQKKPIVTDQKRPIVTDQKKPIVTDQKKPIVTDKKDTVITDKNKTTPNTPPIPPKVPPKVSIPNANRDSIPPQPQTRPYSNYSNQFTPTSDSNSFQQYHQFQYRQFQQSPNLHHHQQYQQSQGNTADTYLQEQAFLPSTVYPPPFYTTRFNKNNNA